MARPTNDESTVARLDTRIAAMIESNPDLTAMIRTRNVLAGEAGIRPIMLLNLTNGESVQPARRPGRPRGSRNTTSEQTPPAVVTGPDGQPVKRGRGRPRKVVENVVTTPAQAVEAAEGVAVVPTNDAPASTPAQRRSRSAANATATNPPSAGGKGKAKGKGKSETEPVATA